MSTTRLEIPIARVERHVPVGQWGASHDDFQQALDDARKEYLERTPDPMITEVPANAIRVVPANGEVVIIFSIENPRDPK